MRNAVALVSGMVLAGAVHGEAEAATFTPDMWVYEVNLVPERNAGFLDWSAFADAPLGTTPPIGCTSVDRPEGYAGSPPLTEIFCPNGTPEIDIIEEIGGLEQFELSPPGRIGFNSSNIFCDEGILIGCPQSGEESSYINRVFFTDVLLDATLGTLSFCAGSADGAGGACYSLSPTLVSANALRNIGNFGRGFWDFGFGGFWQSGGENASGDNYIVYSGTGALLMSPIPLPAPALMLGSAILAFGAFRMHGAGRRQKSRLERG